MNPSNESDSIDLFDFGSPCVVVSHEQRLERLRQKKAEKREPSQHRKSQSTNKKSVDIEFSLENRSLKNDTGGENNRENTSCCESGFATPVERVAGGERLIRTSRKTKERSKGEGSRDKRSVREPRRSEQVDCSTKGGIRVQSEEIKKFPLCEFDTGDKMLAPIKVQFGPTEPDENFLVEIVINDKRYKVSMWSVNDHTYTQGLDSNYLTFKYRV